MVAAEKGAMVLRVASRLACQDERGDLLRERWWMAPPFPAAERQVCFDQHKTWWLATLAGKGLIMARGQMISRRRRR